MREAEEERSNTQRGKGSSFILFLFYFFKSRHASSLSSEESWPLLIMN